MVHKPMLGTSNYEENNTFLSLDYKIKNKMIGNLYDLAKRKAWNVETSIKWELGPENSTYPTKLEANLFEGFPAYDKMSNNKKMEISWQQHSLEISDILHGEQGAMILSAQLITLIPTTEAKLFLSSQVFDEARHMEFFTKYLLETTGKIHPPSKPLNELLSHAFTESTWMKKLLICQIVIESLAMAKFQRIRKETNISLLKIGIDYIIKDEARHVKFGVEFLKIAVAKLNQQEKIILGNFVIESVLNLANNIKVYALIGSEHGWNATSLRHHLRLGQIKNPHLQKEVFRQLTLNLDSIGLFTNEMKLKLEQKGLGS